MKIGLVLSNDWELYGSGCGDYFRDQHRPLEQLHSVALNHGAKLTVMAEIAQYWAHKKLNKEPWAEEICRAWEDILKRIIQDGSDVQLHLHPNWLYSEYCNNEWILDHTKWSTPSLSASEMLEVLMEGKAFLENLLKPIRNDYRCIAFRAGGFCAEPSDIMIRNLSTAGFICDTSVTKGSRLAGYFDYSDAYSYYRPWHTKSDNLKYKGKKGEGVIELPVASMKIIDIPFLRKLGMQYLIYYFNLRVIPKRESRYWQEERKKSVNERYKKPRDLFVNTLINDSAESIIFRFLKQLIRSRSILLDYDLLSPEVFVKILENIYKKEFNKKDRDFTLPIISIGHAKLIHNTDNFNRILEQINKCMKNKVIYISLQEAVENIFNDKVNE